MAKRQTIFLTGATGILGSYLLRFLLNEGHKVYALARDKEEQKAENRVKNALAFWGKSNPKDIAQKLIIIKGDITQRYLGIPLKIQELLIKEVEAVFHCAALTKFNISLDESREVNVNGTKNVLETALLFKTKGNLKKINHISTLFIRGNYKGVFAENDLDVGQEFNTSYEKSKFEAEKMVNDYRKMGLDINVFRLGAVTGETEKGKIAKFENVYQVLNIWSSDLLEFYYIPDGELIMAPVDVVVKMMYFLWMYSKEVNTNHHLIPYSLTIAKFFACAKDHIGFKQQMIANKDDLRIEKLSYAQKVLFRKTYFFSSIASGKVSHALTDKVLGLSHFKMNPLDEVYLLKVFNYALKMNFIKKGKYL